MSLTSPWDHPTFAGTPSVVDLAKRLCMEYDERVDPHRVTEYVVVAARGVVLLGDEPGEHLELIEKIARHQAETYLADLAEMARKV